MEKNPQQSALKLFYLKSIDQLVTFALTMAKSIYSLWN